MPALQGDGCDRCGNRKSQLSDPRASCTASGPRSRRRTRTGSGTCCWPHQPHPVEGRLSARNASNAARNVSNQ